MKLINSTMQKFFMPGNPAAAVKTHLLTQRQADIIKLIKSTDLSLPSIGREVGVQSSYVYHVASRHFTSSFLANRKKRLASLSKKAHLSRKKTSLQAISKSGCSGSDQAIALGSVQYNIIGTSDPLGTSGLPDADFKGINTCQKIEDVASQARRETIEQNMPESKATTHAEREDLSPAYSNQRRETSLQAISKPGCSGSDQAIALGSVQYNIIGTSDPLGTSGLPDADFKGINTCQKIEDVASQARRETIEQNMPESKATTHAEREDLSPVYSTQRRKSSIQAIPKTVCSDDDPVIVLDGVQSDVISMSDPLGISGLPDADFNGIKTCQNIEEAEHQAKCEDICSNIDLQNGIDDRQKLLGFKSATSIEKEKLTSTPSKQMLSSDSMMEEDGYFAKLYHRASKNRIIIECNGTKITWESDQDINSKDISTIIKAIN